MSPWLTQTVAAIHTLSAAAWFGALVYRVMFVDPKAHQFFKQETEYERFSLHLAHGMRYVVMGSLITCGLSGFVLLGLRWNPEQTDWQTLMYGKIGLWVLAFSVFTYVSWVFWPKRVFATDRDLMRLRRQGISLTVGMIGVAALGFLLGQVGQELRYNVESLQTLSERMR
jgi:putative copper export protein